MAVRPPILIAGGGIGGLAAALALAKIGMPVEIIERSPRHQQVGAGIQLGPNGVKILRRLGVGDAVAATASAPEALEVRRGSNGRLLCRVPFGTDIERRHGAPYWVSHRADLHRALAGATRDNPLITSTMGCEIDAVAISEDGLAGITFSDGTSRRAPAVIGADGLWSRIRSTVAPDIALEPSGYGAYRTLIPFEQAGVLARQVVGAWLSPKAHVVHYPVSADREINVVVITRDDWSDIGWNSPADAAAILAAVDGFAPSLVRSIAAAQTWHKWSLPKPVALPTWSRGPIALLGDAAHPMLPFFAQGGVMALEDADALAVAVSADPDDLPKAFRAYAAHRMPRAGRVQAASSTNGYIFHLAGPAALARDLALRALPPGAFLARLDWLYGYE